MFGFLKRRKQNRPNNPNYAGGNISGADHFHETINYSDPLFNENPGTYHLVYQNTKQPTPGAMSYALETLQQRKDTCIGTGMFIRKPIVPLSTPAYGVQSVPTVPLGRGGYEVAGQFYLQPLFDPNNPNGYAAPLWDNDPIEFSQ